MPLHTPPPTRYTIDNSGDADMDTIRKQKNKISKIPKKSLAKESPVKEPSEPIPSTSISKIIILCSLFLFPTIYLPFITNSSTYPKNLFLGVIVVALSVIALVNTL